MNVLVKFIGFINIFILLNLSVPLKAQDKIREHNGFCYKAVAENKAVIAGYIGEEITLKECVLPMTVKLDDAVYTVVGVDDNAFQASNFYFEEVLLPSSLEFIGSYAFEGCRRLKKIILPDNLKTIGSGAFSNTSLNNITLPENLEKLGDRAFALTPLNSIEWGKKLEVIEPYTFYCCDFPTLLIPESVHNIKQYAFSNCKSLKEVTIAKCSDIWLEENVFFDTSVQTVSIAAESYCFSPSTFPSNEITFTSLSANAEVKGASLWQEKSAFAFPAEYRNNYQMHTSLFGYGRREMKIKSNYRNSWIADDFKPMFGNIIFSFSDENEDKASSGLWAPGMTIIAPIEKPLCFDFTYFRDEIGRVEVIINGENVSENVIDSKLTVLPGNVQTIEVNIPDSSGVESLEGEKMCTVYSASGIRVGEFDTKTVMSSLPEGFYVLRFKDGHTESVVR